MHARANRPTLSIFRVGVSSSWHPASRTSVKSQIDAKRINIDGAPSYFPALLNRNCTATNQKTEQTLYYAEKRGVFSNEEVA